MSDNNKALTATTDGYELMLRQANALHKSAYFNDVKTQAQAIVKVMAGAELGLPPFASMAGIHIIHGKPVLGSNVIATLVKNDKRYDYRIVQHDEEGCWIDWYENGECIGQAGFSWVEAQVAKLTGKDNWKKYPSDMLFARAISRGARRFAPGIFGGAPVYTADELGVDTDEEGYIEGETVEPWNDDIADSQDDETPPETGQKPPKSASNGKGNGNEPEPELTPEEHREAALTAPTFKEFAAHAHHFIDGYDSPFAVVGSITKHRKDFRFTDGKQGDYISWLADHKADEEAETA